MPDIACVWQPGIGEHLTCMFYVRFLVSTLMLACLQSLLRQLRWDIPDDVFSNPASLTKLGARISYHLGQARGALKKEVSDSSNTCWLEVNMDPHTAHCEHSRRLQTRPHAHLPARRECVASD